MTLQRSGYTNNTWKIMVENAFEMEASPLGNSIIAFISWTPDPKRLVLDTLFFRLGRKI